MALITWSPRRAELIAFWLTSSLAVGVLITAYALFHFFLSAFVWGICVAVVMAVPGLLWPARVIGAPYKIFRRLAYHYVRCARFILLHVCYFIVFTAVGRCGSLLKLKRANPAESLWDRRETLSPENCIYKYDAGSPNARGNWIKDYLKWTWQSGNKWAACLLPFIIALKSLTQLIEVYEERPDIRSSIYTLY